MTSVKVAELTQDIEELKSLLNAAKRSRVIDALSLTIRKFETDLINLQKEEETTKLIPDNDEAIKSASKNKTTVCYDTKITNYAWDQSDKFVKLYITLKNVHTEPKNVTCEFTSNSMNLVVKALDGKNHHLLINNLMYPIVADGSYYRVKTDQVNIMLKKEKIHDWSHITLQEKKAKDAKSPKLDDDADPSRGLMDMMKKMYDDGDDDMKRTIAKAWTESREKSGDFGM